MSNNLTNEQIARVFAMYIGCRVIYPVQHAAAYWNLLSVGKGISLISEAGFSTSVANKDLQLLLTPLSAISDEDVVVIAKLTDHFCDTLDLPAFKRLYVAKVKLHTPSIVIQYLIQKGYAVPLFIDFGHPDNGKTAIELGLAIEKEIQP